MIGYIKCLCGSNKLLARKLKEQGYDVRVVNLNPEYRKEAAAYKTKLPFTVENGIITKL
jgi:prephenate dehydrogenase